MAYKKHNWINNNRKGMKVELKVLDEDNSTLDFFRWISSDKKTSKRISNILNKTYGINLSTTKESRKSLI